jgi:2-succinyl-6-hydroxy-2,4-cyclohexadiene-1-carboxylate synthase
VAHLHRTTLGDAGHQTVFVHGFTQTGASWDPILATYQEPGDRLTTVDLPGHGGSSQVRADLWETADLLADVAEGERTTWVGYSLGARCCLHLALAHPRLVDELVLIGGTAGIEDSAERAARVARDEALADHIVEVGVAAFLDEWLAQPLFAGLTADTDGRDARLVNTVEGLASSLRMCGTGTQDPLWDRLRDIGASTLLLAGERDERFVAHANRMAELIPHAKAFDVPGAGHAAHLEDPEAFTMLWLAWDARLI